MILDNSVFTGGITLNYGGELVVVVDSSNPDVDLASQVAFAGLTKGVGQMNLLSNIQGLLSGFKKNKESKDATEQKDIDGDMSKELKDAAEQKDLDEDMPDDAEDDNDKEDEEDEDDEDEDDEDEDDEDEDDEDEDDEDEDDEDEDDE